VPTTLLKHHGFAIEHRDQGDVEATLDLDGHGA